jgi:RNA polymerase sigma factor (sigma-70 family)
MKKAKDLAIKLDEDVRLMLHLSKGNVSAFNILYKKYFKMLSDYIGSLNGNLNTEDITQEVFLRAWNRKKEYSPDSTVKTYLFGIAKNVVSEHYRKYRHQISNYDNDIISIASDAKTVAENKELAETVLRAKSRLSLKQRKAIELVLFSEISTDKAAKLSGCAENVFRQRLYNARKHLIKILGRSFLKNK